MATSTITLLQATSAAQQAGFSGSALAIIVAIAQAESGLNYKAQNCNNSGGSCDRGIVQINNYWHSEVPDSCAYDVLCSFQQAFRISESGTNFNPWTTYTSGTYKTYLGRGPQPADQNTLTLQQYQQQQQAGNTTPGTPQGLLDWLSNPLRIFKIVGGIALVFIGLILIVAPSILASVLK